MSRPLGAMPEYLYQPSDCNRALMARPSIPGLEGIDAGGLDYPTISRMTRTYGGYHGGCGAAIAAAREDAGWTQRQLAEAVGITQGSVANYENNRHSIPHRTALLIADALGITADELLYGVREAAVAD